MKKLILLCSGVTAGLLAFTLAGSWWLGAFNAVELSREPRGPYRIAYLPHRGAYTGVVDKILEVQERLADAADQLGPACGIYYDNPAEVPEEQLRSKGGVLITGDVSVDPSLLIEEIPQRDVLVARFDGHPSLAPVKVYPRMAEWMEEHGVEPAGPAVEFYRPKRFRRGSVECEIPIRPAEE